MRAPALLLFAALACGCGGPLDDGDAGADLTAPLRLGFNWGNAAKVYVDHWDQRSVKASDPSRPFRVARKNHVHLMRVFAGTDDVVARWHRDPAGTIKDLRRMLDAARANGVKLILSTRLDQATIEQLSGTTYQNWGEAQHDLVSAGSAAWDGYLAFQESIVGALGRHASAYSWEATNEPEWMLGEVAPDDLAAWLNAAQDALHRFGAARVNMGGANLDQMSDDEVALATEHADILDAHFYPDYDAGGAPVGSNAQDLIDAFAAEIARVEAITGKRRQAMVGEFGTATPDWFGAVARECVARGWPALAWEFDGWDQFWFNDAHHADVLALLAKLDPR